MNFFNKQTYAVLLQVKQVAIMVPGLSTTSSLSNLSTPTPPTSSTQDVEGSIPDPASIECESEDKQERRDRCVTQPIKQCRCRRVSEQKLKVRDKYGETRYLAACFEKIEDMMREDADKDGEQVFNVT